jgi:hypothetical protein
MNRRFFLIGLFCLINLSLPCFAKEWRNMFPLKTTRAEVLKLLGEPQTSEAIEGEYFKVDDGFVKIRWKRPDCFTSEVIMGEESLKHDFLVYQITFIPKEPLSWDSIESEKSIEEKDSPKVSGNVKTEVKDTYKKWLSQDIDCLIGTNNTLCSVMGRYNGFGYSSSNEGITALYYYPTEKESAEWKEKLLPCSVEQR